MSQPSSDRASKVGSSSTPSATTFSARSWASVIVERTMVAASLLLVISRTKD